MLEVCREMERNGCRVTYVEVDRNGNLDMPGFIRALAGDPAGVDHARQQRDRRGVSHRPAVAHRQGDRPGHRLSHRRHPDGGEAAHRYGAGVSLRGPSLLFGAQAARTQGGGRPLPAPRHPDASVSTRGAPGGGPARGDRKRPLHRGPRPGLQPRDGQRAGGRGPDRAPPRPAGAGPGGEDPFGRDQRRRGPAPAEHPEHLLSLHRGGGDAVSARRVRDLRLERVGLHLRVARAFARAAGDESALHGGAWLGPLQPEPLYHRRGDRPGARSVPGHRSQPAHAFPYWDNAVNAPIRMRSGCSKRNKKGAAGRTRDPRPPELEAGDGL